MQTSGQTTERPDPARSMWWSAAIWLCAGLLLLSGIPFVLSQNYAGILPMLAGGGILWLWSRLEQARIEDLAPLREDRDRLGRMLDATLDGMWEFDLQTRLFFCSECGWKLAGLDLAQAGIATLRGMLRRISREQRRRLLQAVREAMAGAQRFDELVHVVQPGSTTKRWLKIRGSVSRDGRFITGVISDVSGEVSLAREQGLNQGFIEAVLDSLPLPVSVKSERGVLMLANRAYCAALDVQPRDVLGKTAKQLIPGDIAERLNALDRLTLETGESHVLEDWLSIPLLGRRSFLRITKCRCVDRKGQPVVVSIFENQTDVREYASRMARLSVDVEAFVRRLLHSIPYPIYVKNAESRYVMANVACARLWGMHLDDIIGLSSSELFGAERGEAMEAEDRRVFAGETVQKEDCVPDPGTGQPRYWVVSKSVCTDVEGQQIIIGANFEITDVRQKELELSESLERQTHLRQFMQRLFDAVPHPMSVKDTQHRYIMVNRSQAEFHGKTPEQLLGASTYDWLDSEVAAVICEEEDALFASAEDVAEKASEIVVHDATGVPHQFMTRRIVCAGSEGERVVLGISVDVTQIRQLEANLRSALAWQQRSQKFLRDIFDAIPTPVSVKDRQHHYLLANRALADAFGMKTEEMVGKTTTQVNLPEVARETIEADEKLFAIGPGVVSDRNVPLLYADGVVHKVRLQKVVCLDPDGAQVLITSNSDVTELIEKEAALTQSLQRQTETREFLQTVFDMLPFATYVKDEKSSWVLANTALSNFFGMPRHVFAGRNMVEFVPAVTAWKIAELDRQLLARDDGEVLSAEVLMVNRLRQNRSIVVYEKLVRDAEGKQVLIGVHHDVTELREIECRQAITLGQLDKLVNNAPLGIALLDVEGRFLRANPALCEMLGRKAEDLQGISYRVGLPDEVQPILVPSPDLPPDTVWQPQISVIINAGGHQFPVLVSAVSVGQPGADLAFWVLVQDISAQKAAEDQLLRHRDQLRQLVLEQTQDLLLAKEAAERSSAAKSDLIAQLSHELRTPLHAILSFARLGIERGGQLSTGKVQEYFTRVAESGERLISLLDSLLDLARLESGRISLSMCPSELPRLVDEVVTEFEALLIANRLELKRLDAPSLPLLVMDVPRIAQVLRNLMSNAIKFAPAQSCITLQTRLVRGLYGRRAHDQQEDTMVEIIVRDEGRGIPEDELEQIFERFTQSSLTRDVAGGTGLGLAICREIVLAHRGEIFARNAERGGAEFIVRLPLGDAGHKNAGDDA